MRRPGGFASGGRGTTGKLWVDGGSRGNPGPSAIGFVLATGGDRQVKVARTIGEATNNVAEYTALAEGLVLALGEGVSNLEVRSDSELLVRQIRGQYKVRHPNLLSLYERVRGLISRFQSFEIRHVRREQNREADRLVNLALDGRLPGG